MNPGIGTHASNRRLPRLVISIAVLGLLQYSAHSAAQAKAWSELSDADLEFISGYHPPETKNKIALSLISLANSLATGKTSAEAPLRMSRVRGIMFDEQNNPILLGCEQVGDGIQPITPDDIAVALRNVLSHHGSPGMSIDPAPMEQRHVTVDGERIPTPPSDYDPSGDTQFVVYFGGIERTQPGYYLYDADYWMKALAAGRERVDVTDFQRYSDLIIERIREGNHSPVGGSRFWYYPLASSPIVTPNRQTVVLEGSGVQVLTEVTQYIREMNSLGRAFDAVPQNHMAEGFVESMTERYDELCTFRPSLARLRNFFALCEVFEIVKRSLSPEKLQYFLTEYEPVQIDTPTSIDTLVVKHFRYGFGLSGGVNCSFNHPAYLKPRRTHDLLQLRSSVLGIAPRDNLVQWSFDIEFTGFDPLPTRELSAKGDGSGIKNVGPDSDDEDQQ